MLPYNDDAARMFYMEFPIDSLSGNMFLKILNHNFINFYNERDLFIYEPLNRYLLHCVYLNVCSFVQFPPQHFN